LHKVPEDPATSEDADAGVFAYVRAGAACAGAAV
jgi:hypothetical protein